MSWSREETQYLLRGLFEHDLCTFDLKCFYRPNHPNYPVIQQIAKCMHICLPTANDGQERTIAAIYNYIRRALGKKYSLDADGFQQAEEDYGINYYEDNVAESGVPPIVERMLAQYTTQTNQHNT